MQLNQLSALDGLWLILIRQLLVLKHADIVVDLPNDFDELCELPSPRRIGPRPFHDDVGLVGTERDLKREPVVQLQQPFRA